MDRRWSGIRRGYGTIHVASANARHGPWRGPVPGNRQRQTRLLTSRGAREDVPWRRVPRNVTVQPSTVFTTGRGRVRRNTHLIIERLGGR